MNRERFVEKIITLRKQRNLTQQDLAERLNVSNKTISRWETQESFPDIEMLKELADIFHVSTDYLLSDNKDFKEFNREEMISYMPLMIAFLAVLSYYIFIKLSMPTLFAFVMYYVLLNYSYRFLKRYTDRKHLDRLTKFNTMTVFFVGQNICFSILTIFAPSVSMYFTPEDLMMYAYVISFIVAGIFAIAHYAFRPEFK